MGWVEVTVFILNDWVDIQTDCTLHCFQRLLQLFIQYSILLFFLTYIFNILLIEEVKSQMPDILYTIQKFQFQYLVKKKEIYSSLYIKFSKCIEKGVKCNSVYDNNIRITQVQ